MASGFIGGGWSRLARKSTTSSSNPRDRSITTAEGSKLPTLVCEMVIDFVARQVTSQSLWYPDIAKTLRACSLTCRAWTPRSQYHLFRFLAVRCSNKHVRSIVAFLNKNPALQSRVEALVIKPRSRLNTTLDNIPTEITDLLFQVRELRLSGCFLRVTAASTLENSLGRFTFVTSFHIYNAGFESFNDLQRIITSFPRLRRLSIYSPRWWIPKSDLPNLVSVHTSLRLFEIDIAVSANWLQDERGAAFLEWLASSGIVLSLTKLMLDQTMTTTDTALSAVQTVVHAAANTLQCIAFSPGPDLDYTEFGETLARCTHLNVLVLCIPHHVPAFLHLTSFLASSIISCPRLALRFNDYPKCLHPTAVEWNGLDNVLQSPQWQSLRCIFICHSVKEVGPFPLPFTWGDLYPDKLIQPGTLCESLPRSLSRTRSRGILFFISAAGHRMQL